MNQQKPEILDTQTFQNNGQDIQNKPFGQNNQQSNQMQYNPNQNPNNRFPQAPTQFPGQINQFQFQQNQGIAPMMTPGQPGMGPGMITPNLGAQNMGALGPQNMGAQNMGPPGMGPPGMGPPGMGPPGMGPPGMVPPGMVPPGMGAPNMGPPGMGTIGTPGMGTMGPLSNMVHPLTITSGITPPMFQLPQHQAQFPPQMIQPNIPNINEDVVQIKKEELKKKNDEIKNLQNEKKALNQQKEELEGEFKKQKEDQEREFKKRQTNQQNQFNEEIQELKQQIQNYKEQIQQFEENQRRQEQQKKKQQNEINNLQNDKQYLEQQIMSLGQNNSQNYQQYKIQNDELNYLKSQITELQNKINTKDKQIQQLNQQIDVLKNIKQPEIQKEPISQSFSKQQQIEYDQKIDNLNQENNQLLDTINKMEQDQKDLQQNYEMLEIDIKMYKEIAQYYEQCKKELNNVLEQNYQRGQGDVKNENQEYLKEFLSRQEEIKKSQQDQIKLEKEKIQQKRLQDQQQQKQLNLQGRQRMNELIRKVGQIQCCFVIDLYKSTEKAGKAIIQATQNCCTSIKKITNRDSSWGAVCYGYTKSGLQIKCQQFTQKSDDLKEFLMSQQKVQQDQKDQPEDLKSALKQMLTLNWTEKYKLAILIPNSPCHGKKFHHPKKYSRFWGIFKVDYDTKPNDDMNDIILEVVKREIFVLVIIFNEDTKVMCSQLKNIYSALNQPQLFHTLSVKGLDSSYDIVLNIQKMAAFIIGTGNQMTKTKINDKMRMQNFKEGLNDMKKLKEEVVIINKEIQNESQKQGQQQKGDLPQVSVQDAIEDKRVFEEAAQRIQDCTDGALEALCRRGDIANFETRVQCENLNCKVYSVELKQQSFENKKESIEQIKYEANDFDCIEQANWQCIRTQNPFAFGMMKKVYLMKKKNNNEEIYVVKVPIEKGTYNTLADAINDCRSHLIAKNMMKVFMEKIRSQNQKLQMVQYTDFLILEENQDKYWIAERFFKGNFKKYNNNDGYICDEDCELNKISQAFSYYTYQISQYNYIINDIQGVDNYFTDPAINTIKGNFDETDVGEDGMSNYLSTLQMKKELCENLLKSIDIDID